MASCSTKKNTAYRRAYHNITSRYNVYFYAREAYKAGVKTAEEAHKDDYNEILPLFKYTDKDAIGAASSDMETAITKCIKLIKLHSLTVKPKRKPKEMTAKEREFYDKREYNKWVDDTYLLMGKSYFYKDDKYSASKNFEFVIAENKKKPIRFRAMLWMARTKTELKQYEDAIEILNKAKAEPDFPEHLIKEYATIYADVYIRKEQYAEAIPLLETAISLERRKKNRVRYVFILAQISKKSGNAEKAMDLYKRVVKMNPPYEMAFAAKIQMATAFEGGSSEEIVKILKKMLRDDKNRDFRDQIYYALANIEYQQGNITKALELYTMSAALSVDNDYQKAMSYLAMGEIYYDRKDYLNAQPYYDSSVSVLPETYRNYEKLVRKSKNLNDLAKEFKTVAKEDSLQKLAKMPTRDLELLVEDLIEKLRYEEERKRELAAIQRQNASMYNQSFAQNDAQGQGGKWYFYNPVTLQHGKKDFQLKWGAIKLEDHWRRSNKKVVDWLDETDEDDEEIADSLAPKRVADKMSPKYYLQDIPFADSALAVSHARIKEALLVAGIIFMDRIEDEAEAIRVFTDLINRYPEYEQMPMVYYFISLLYNSLEDEKNAEVYRSKVIDEYPDSKYAQALINPNYFREIRAKEIALEKNYKKARKAYFRKNYSEVVTVVDSVQNAFPNNKLTPRYRLLQGMAIGKMTDMSTFKKEMIFVKDSFPGTEPSEVASKILDYIAEHDLKELPKDTIGRAVSDSLLAERLRQDEEDKEIYFPADTAEHSLLFVGKTDKIDFNRLKFNMINYNLEYFANFNFSLEIVKLDDNYSYLQLKSLSNAEQAYNYYELVNISPEIFDGIEKIDIEFFVIAQANLKTFRKDKRIEKYISFFFDNYQR